MHLGRAGSAHHLDDLSAGRATDDAVVDQDDTLSGKYGVVGRVLQLHAEIADVISRLNESAADIMVADDAQLERDAALRAVAHRGGNTAIWHRHDDIGLDTALAGEFGADPLARVVDGHGLHLGVRPGEVDVFEHAEPALGGAERLDAAHTLVVYDDDLAGLDVADEMGADDIERTRFAGEHPAAGALTPDAAQDQRPHTKRVTHTHQRVVR